MYCQADLKNLDNYDDELLGSFGWRLDRIFEGNKGRSLLVYREGSEYALKLLTSYEVGLRTVNHNSSTFVEIYKK